VGEEKTGQKRESKFVGKHQMELKDKVRACRFGLERKGVDLQGARNKGSREGDEKRILGVYVSKVTQEKRGKTEGGRLLLQKKGAKPEWKKSTMPAGKNQKQKADLTLPGARQDEEESKTQPSERRKGRVYSYP